MFRAMEKRPLIPATDPRGVVGGSGGCGKLKRMAEAAPAPVRPTMAPATFLELMPPQTSVSPKARFVIEERLRAEYHGCLDADRVKDFLQPRNRHGLVIAFFVAADHLLAHAQPSR